MGAQRARRRAIALDAGALIATESARGRALLREICERDQPVVIAAGALGQAWRDPARQALLAGLVARRETTVASLDGATAKACGTLLARTGHDDVIDAQVVLSARLHRAALIVTSDPSDLRRLDPEAELRLI